MADNAREAAGDLQRELSNMSAEFDGLWADLQANVRRHFPTEEQQASFDRMVEREDRGRAAYAWAQEKVDKLHSLLWEV